MECTSLTKLNFHEFVPIEEMPVLEYGLMGSGMAQVIFGKHQVIQ